MLQHCKGVKTITSSYFVTVLQATQSCVVFIFHAQFLLCGSVFVKLSHRVIVVPLRCCVPHFKEIILIMS